MRYRAPFFLVLIGICLLACLLIFVKGNSTAIPKPERVVETSDSESNKATAANQEAYLRQTQAGIRRLAEMESQKLMRDQAAANMKEVRGQLQFNLRAAWQTIINTNAEVFQ